MRRAYRKRIIDQPPVYQHFKPVGIPRRFLKSVSMTLDEYEAIRLADYQGLEHRDAAESMKISRPTFTRLIEKARHKIAQVLVEGQELVFSGGNVEYQHTRHRCRDCGDERLVPRESVPGYCPECGSHNQEDVAERFTSSEDWQKEG